MDVVGSAADAADAALEEEEEAETSSILRRRWSWSRRYRAERRIRSGVSVDIAVAEEAEGGERESYCFVSTIL